MPANDTKVTFRLPSGLRDAIAQLAESERRSVNSQIVLLLERAVTQHPSSEPMKGGLSD